jgi:hypothetical protein
MKRLAVIATAVIVVLVGVLTFNVAAQQPDTRDRTIMTFSAAVELPGMKLEPGTYVFKIADTASRNVIQVLSDDEMKVLGQWLFVSAERLEATGDTVVTFRETDAKSTPAVQFWYYPGERIGKEFIYPKDQAQRIAKRTGTGVLTEEGRVNAEGQIAAADDKPEASPEPAATAADSGIGVVEGSGPPPEPAVEAKTETAVEARAETRAARAPEPAPTPRTAAPPAAAERPVGTSGQQEAAPAQTTRNELPATASPLALSGLLGLLSLIGAAGIRAFKL